MSPGSKRAIAADWGVFTRGVHLSLFFSFIFFVFKTGCKGQLELFSMYFLNSEAISLSSVSYYKNLLICVYFVTLLYWGRYIAAFKVPGTLPGLATRMFSSSKSQGNSENLGSIFEVLERVVVNTSIISNNNSTNTSSLLFKLIPVAIPITIPIPINLSKPLSFPLNISIIPVPIMALPPLFLDGDNVSTAAIKEALLSLLQNRLQLIQANFTSNVTNTVRGSKTTKTKKYKKYRDFNIELRERPPVTQQYFFPATSLEDLRKRYGTRKSVWGEWTTAETRQFYRIQLPRALQVSLVALMCVWV